MTQTTAAEALATPAPILPATPDPKVDAVLRLYEAYGRGDIDVAMADLADDVDWAAEAAGTAGPWFGPHLGKAEVPRFFAEIGSNVDVTEFTVVSLTSNDIDVVAIVHWAYTVRSTGRSTAMYMQHWWRFASGPENTIVFFRGSEDTEQTARAFA